MSAQGGHREPPLHEIYQWWVIDIYQEKFGDNWVRVKFYSEKIFPDYTEVHLMSNDKDWQRRTEEWIEATNESRKRKEKRNEQKLDNQSKGNDYEKKSKNSNQN